MTTESHQCYDKLCKKDDVIILIGISDWDFENTSRAVKSNKVMSFKANIINFLKFMKKKTFAIMMCSEADFL